MKNFLLILAILLLSITISSCKKKTIVVENPSEDNTTTAIEVYTGVSDNTFDSILYQPNFEVPIIWDVQNLYGVGEDSLDFDQDGLYDFYMKLSLLNQANSNLLTGLPDPFPNCVLRTNNGYEIGFYTQSFPIGLGQTSTISFVDRHDLNERIDLNSNWSTAGKMWQENPSLTQPYGDWHGANGTYYISIRKDNVKYGWIEVDATNHENPKIVRMAIQQ